jgi:hypothetical protein
MKQLLSPTPARAASNADLFFLIITRREEGIPFKKNYEMSQVVIIKQFAIEDFSAHHVKGQELKAIFFLGTEKESRPRRALQA